MLSDYIINALQNMLNNQEYPDVKGLQDPFFWGITI